MRKTILFTLALFLLNLNCQKVVESKPDLELLKKQVTETERAFAKTMADRNHSGFISFLADETIFLGPGGPIRGKAQVSAAWKGLYEGEQAPFSWEPETVEVQNSGKLAISTGPVYDPNGKVFSIFTSIWRQESPGVWKIVFDRGCDVCEKEK